MRYCYFSSFKCSQLLILGTENFPLAAVVNAQKLPVSQGSAIPSAGNVFAGTAPFSPDTRMASNFAGPVNAAMGPHWAGNGNATREPANAVVSGRPVGKNVIAVRCRQSVHNLL